MNDTTCTTYVIVICPRCAQEVTLPAIKVEVEVGDTISFGHHGDLPASLNAEVHASGPHACPRPSMEYKQP